MEDILKFWIIEKKSGICIFQQTFQELAGHVEDDIVPNYLFAVLCLSKEITEQNVSYLQLKDLRFTFNISEKYVMIIVISSEVPHNKTVQRLRVLQKRFEEKYEHVLKKGFSGDISDFNNFAEEVEKIFQSEAIHFQYINKRKEQLKEYFNSQSNKWKMLNQLILTDKENMGKWIGIHKMHIDTQIKKKVIEDHNKSILSNKKDTKNQVGKGSWI